MARVGMIGLGNLGGPIGEQLAASGLTTTVYDTVPAATGPSVAAGATALGSPAEVAAASDVTLICVRTAEQAADVLRGEDSLLDGAKPGHVVGLISTVLPDAVREFAELAAGHDVTLIDTPAAGTGEAGVRARTMWTLAGGDDEAIDALEPALRTYCSRVLRAGPLGSGAAAKLSHNAMIYLSYLATYEATEVARAAGVRDGVLAEVTRATGALSTQSDLYLGILEARRVITGMDEDHDRFAGASAVLEKDLRHAIDLAAQFGVDLPGARLVRTMGDTIFQVRATGDPA
ncbi:NAD(P)-dependent oxidoreductase [Frankia sp. AgKG'84/4]|uniref:NAD(P)-dependent oxidoreductase n=1 Tax=Frankia sp. AgKG'84/4 TaxID=573490 RepID=UPI0020109488|nr:NAD(P)-dependent oxidoreductase [Frankia sp. AgKG'84/4]MCL9795770.1 NAD(P)-dependent oxidoreductase [Frankia sp. AgKG'84/4]